MELNEHAHTKPQTRLSGPNQISNQVLYSPCNILISLSAEMPHSIATLRDLAAALQKAKENYLERFNSTAVVARVAIWDGNTTARGISLYNSLFKTLFVDVTFCIG